MYYISVLRFGTLHPSPELIIISTADTIVMMIGDLKKKIEHFESNHGFDFNQTKNGSDSLSNNNSKVC